MKYIVLRSIGALALGTSLFGAEVIQSRVPVQVHEWGTFTSVAGSKGESVPWAPLAATSDLPCFVHTLGKGVVKFTPGLVRMETPVVYFYSKAPTRVAVHVDFPEGWITEWYPKATRISPDNPESYGTNAGGGAMYNPQRGSIDWSDLAILPGSQALLPTSKGASRYFAARATDAAPLQAGDENEKLLFYRGIANFKVAVQPVVQGDSVQIRNAGVTAIPVVILFSNENGHIGYRVARDVKDTAVLRMPELTAGLDSLRSELTTILEQRGLYPKEAAAMVETWRDAWFEEGMRVFYIAPRQTVDSVLPLRVTPTPLATERVFVGRVEVLSPWTEATIRNAMEKGETETLAKFGRFLGPFRSQIKEKGARTEAPLALAYAQQVEAGIFHQESKTLACVK